MQEKLMRMTTFLVSVTALAAMAVMLNFASAKTIVIAEAAASETGEEQKDERQERESTPISLEEDMSLSTSICIPLPETVKPDDIIIENSYMEHRIQVIIKGAEKDFYNKKKVVGEISRIKTAVSYEESGAVVLAFGMDGLYEHKYLLEENALYLDFVNPHEMYEKIVVLDAGHGGADNGNEEHGLVEADFALFIAEEVQSSLEDSDIRVYCTRQDDRDVDTAQRISFINELRPDFVVSIHLNSSPDIEKYGTEVWYSADYVIPGFGNAELADTLERNVVTAVDGRANGLLAYSAADAEEDAAKQLLTGVRVPTAVLQAGYLTNARERELLMQPEYQKRIAEGICRGLEAVRF